MDTIRPEPGNADKVIDSCFEEIAFIPRVVRIVVDGMRDRPVAVDFLKSDFPIRCGIRFR